MENHELAQQRKFFEATGLNVGDMVTNVRTGERGPIYFSGTGYACVRLGEWRAQIWDAEFVAE